MIHLVDEQALRIRQVAGEMERQILPSPAAEQVVARDHAGHDQRRMLGLVALTDEILVRVEIAHDEAERAHLGEILLVERGVPAEVPDQHVVGLVHATAKKCAGSIK